MKKQAGFTLIELLVVIMILGILSVTAAPKFLDLGGDARSSTVKGMKGALSGAVSLVYAKAQVQGLAEGQNTITVDGLLINLSDGYPITTATTNLENIVDYDTSAFTFSLTSDAEEVVVYPVDVTQPGSPTTGSTYYCAIVYKYTVGSAPVISTANMDQCE